MSTILKRGFWPVLGLCALLALLILALMPAEKTLGQVIKVVYLHGALSRAGMLGILAAGVCGAAYLILRRPALARWTQGLILSGWLFWTLNFLVSMPATRLTWGMWIAWGEPRVTMTLQVIAVTGIAIVISRLLETPLFTAAVNLLLGGTILLLGERTGVLRHPLDPIGGSPSNALRLAYLALLIPLILAMILVAGRLGVAGSPPTERQT